MNIILPKTFTASDITSNLTDTTESEYVETNTYSVNDIVWVADTIFPKRLYTALDTVPTYSYPPDNPALWQDNGCPNKWKMFDEFLTTQSEAATDGDTIEIILNSNLQSRVALFNLKGSQVVLEFRDSAGTVIETQTESLVDNKIADWYEWLFYEFLYTEDVIFNFPAWQVSSIKITVSSTILGVKPAIGSCILGKMFDLGYTQYDIKTSIIDYSTKKTNAFGDTYLHQGKYVKLMDLDILTDSFKYDVINRALISVRGKATIFEGNNEDSDYSSFRIYGFLRDFDQILPSRDLMRCSLQIQGLT